MAIPIKDPNKAADKWSRAAAAATSDYQSGVEGTQKNWATNTGAANAAWKTGVNNAISKDTFAKGVSKAGHQTWKDQTLAKGVGRWAQGIAASQARYAAGFEPFRSVIANLTLPARAERGNPSNINRVAIIAKALHDKKVALQG